MLDKKLRSNMPMLKKASAHGFRVGWTPARRNNNNNAHAAVAFSLFYFFSRQIQCLTSMYTLFFGLRFNEYVTSDYLFGCMLCQQCIAKRCPRLNAAQVMITLSSSKNK